MSYTYLASPYTHEDPVVREFRFTAACKAAALLMSRGERVFCPIAHSHPIAVWGGEGNATDGEFWKKQDIPLLQHSSKLTVLMLPGWESSTGILWEIDMAKKLGIPVTYMWWESDGL